MSHRIHFAYSRSRRYPQALELAPLADRHEVRGQGHSVWHILHFRDDQLDLMAAVYALVKGFSPHSMASLGKAVFTEAHRDMLKAAIRLREEGYEDSYGREGYIAATRKPSEPRVGYRDIRHLIAEGSYKEAVDRYYGLLGDKPYDELHSELLYLKRLGSIPLVGRDILPFRPESAYNELVRRNLAEYCSCIDSALGGLDADDPRSPDRILAKSVATLPELIQHEQQRLDTEVFLRDGNVARNSETIGVDFFGTFACPRGRLFDRYVNPLVPSFTEEQLFAAPSDAGLWVIYPPDFVEQNITAKGLRLAGIDAYRHKRWREGSKKREPPFTSVRDMEEICLSDCGGLVGGVRYTGRTHCIQRRGFYEVDLLIRLPTSGEDRPSSLQEAASEILREAENILRETHGLPRIGEGWVSEMELYDLVKEIFPTAVHHDSPGWLVPQHLDIHIPSVGLAFEYQGRQHFEPVEFFGGTEAFEATKQRDAVKARKCKANGVSLIYWRYDEPIARDMLKRKLQEMGIRDLQGG